jgi:hypothetical protein
LVSALELQETIRRSARLAPLQILRKTGAGPDHPVGLDFPEGEYLKAFWMRDMRMREAAAAPSEPSVPVDPAIEEV